MKKFFKFLCGAASVAAVAFGAYCVYKNVIAKDEDDDDFDDCFDEEAVDAAAEEAAPPEPSAEEKLLTEIRDLLKEQK